MKHPHPLLFSLQEMVIDFSLINRNHYLARTQRKENDSEHTLSVAVLCWFVHDNYNIDLDISKILKYAISHDFVEVHAGDTNTFASDKLREKKVILERESLAKLSEDFNGFSGFVAAMNAYESKEDPESLFVWTIDKMQALIMGDMDNWRPYKELNISYEDFCKKYAQQLKQSSPYCREIFEGLIEYCKTTYYDKPKTSIKYQK